MIMMLGLIVAGYGRKLHRLWLSSIAYVSIGLKGTCVKGRGGLVVDPDGAVLALTDRTSPFRTAEVALSTAEAAKLTYPRYVDD
ncbi:MAG: hypothetical protein MUQ30_07265 [Anaerolineae bacterium]|nr:hypothetical protein [Anaerolineae bacterium]